METNSMVDESTSLVVASHFGLYNRQNPLLCAVHVSITVSAKCHDVLLGMSTHVRSLDFKIQTQAEYVIGDCHMRPLAVTACGNVV